MTESGSVTGHSVNRHTTASNTNSKSLSPRLSPWSSLVATVCFGCIVLIVASCCQQTKIQPFPFPSTATPSQPSGNLPVVQGRSLEEQQQQQQQNGEGGVETEFTTISATPITTTATTTTTTTTNNMPLWTPDEQEMILAQIREKLRPHDLLWLQNDAGGGDEDDNADTTSSSSLSSSSEELQFLRPRQFVHLHHMKTGGTSVDKILSCARERLSLQQDSTSLGKARINVSYTSIHECARGKFANCLANVNDPCRNDIHQATTMSFCASLAHLAPLGWDWDGQDTTTDGTTTDGTTSSTTSRRRPPPFHAVTVLRHPVDRVWSMFRFETKKCYLCKNLTDFYDQVDRGETEGLDDLCVAQLINHQTTNLLRTTTTSTATTASSDEEKVQEAIETMTSFFTLIGLTEELTLTTQMLGYTFPWLNKTIDNSRKRCGLTHSNPTPSNNYCQHTLRADGTTLATHWDLPDHPDEATRMAIEAHNQLDLRLYDAAVQYFALQKQVWEEQK